MPQLSASASGTRGSGHGFRECGRPSNGAYARWVARMQTVATPLSAGRRARLSAHLGRVHQLSAGDLEHTLEKRLRLEVVWPGTECLLDGQ